MVEPVTLPGKSLLRPISALTPASDLDFIEDLYMGQVLKVPKNGKKSKFCNKHLSNGSQITRRARHAVPQFLGLVGTHDQVIAVLEDFIDGDTLSELDINEISAAQQQEWKQQIEQTMILVHTHRFIRGDVKAANVLVDKDERLWSIDFGGSCTEGWVDEHLAEAMEGDLQGLRRLVE